MSLDKIKAKLAELNKQAQKPSNSGTSSKNLYWKPGQNKDDKGNCLPDVIRILPNKHSIDPEYPFLELPIYWPKSFGKTWISPSFYSQADPVIEYCQDLFKDFLEKPEYNARVAIKRAIYPENRFYALVLVRGKESEGPKWWSFGIEVFREIGLIMTDSDYGLIHDLENGHDLTINYTPGSDNGQRAKTAIRPKPSKTVATTDSEILNQIQNVENVADSFVCPTYKELDEALRDYTKVEPEVKQTPSNPNNVRTNHVATNEGFDMKNFQVPGSEPKQPTSQVDVSDIEKQFEDLLNGK